MTQPLRDTLLAPARALANPTLMFFALPWLMVLLVLGTVAQRYLGLYESQKLFFGSFVLWAGMVPLPGAYSVLMLVALSLLAKLALKSPLKKEQAGTIFVHVSAVVLLVGGLLTALGREDGYIVLGDGESASTVLDYQARELVVTKNGERLAAFSTSGLRGGDVLTVKGVPFTLQVTQRCFPCAVQARTGAQANLRGAAEKITLVQIPYQKNDAQNLGGMEFAVSGAGSADGTYIACERLAAPESLTLNKDRYGFALAPEQRTLPFAVQLNHFTKEDYPGTDEARAYSSDVTVRDGGLSWDALIEMNEPLRYKGYTLYQSSFVDDNGKRMSVLAVVKNAGEWFPYIAISLLCAGLVLHVLIVLGGRAKESKL